MSNPGGGDGKAHLDKTGDCAVSFMTNDQTMMADQTIMDTSGLGYLNYNNKLAKQQLKMNHNQNVE